MKSLAKFSSVKACVVSYPSILFKLNKNYRFTSRDIIYINVFEMEEQIA